MPQSRAARPRPLLAMLLVVALPASHGWAVDGSDPIPVLGGVLAPGPRRLRLDPSTIGNFQGLVALAYLGGRVRDATGHRWVMANDIRLFQGDYVPLDGTPRRGTFAFV